MANDKIVEIWNEINVILESLNIDVRKNAAGNASAGVRSRRGLRLLRTRANDLIKMTLDIEKARKENE
jgi:hypothetical protein